MSAPPVYAPATNFAQDEAGNAAGRSTIRTANLDVELQALATTLDAILTNRSYIQRDDLELQDLIVKLHTLSPEVIDLIGSAGFTVHNPVVWATAIDYSAGELVTESGSTYVSVSAHTSGVFATDLAAGKWLLLYNPSTAGAISATPSGNLSGATVQAQLYELDVEKLGKADTLHTGASVRGLWGRNSGGTSATIFQLTAAEIRLRQTGGTEGVLVTGAGTLSVDVTVAGPVAGGRDQSAAFTASTFIHLYFIRKADGTLNLIASAATPAAGAGPTLPTDYTHYCYACTLRLGASSTLFLQHVVGSWVFYELAQSVGVITPIPAVATTVDFSPYVPTVAPCFEMCLPYVFVTSSAGGIILADYNWEIGNALSHFRIYGSLQSVGAAASNSIASGVTKIMPNIGVTLRHSLTVTTGGTSTVAINVTGFRCPNGDS